jgi:DNA polymerase-3 subunit epsilon
MVDTLQIARTRHPGAKHTLDALCSRYGIDRSHRVLHGALLDAQLLAQVYVELRGGRQIGLTLEAEVIEVVDIATAPVTRVAREPRRFGASEGELLAHAAFLEKVKEPIWFSG